MSTSGDFGNPLRKFKLVFLGEQSGMSFNITLHTHVKWSVYCKYISFWHAMSLKVSRHLFRNNVVSSRPLEMKNEFANEYVQYCVGHTSNQPKINTYLVISSEMLTNHYYLFQNQFSKMKYLISSNLFQLEKHHLSQDLCMTVLIIPIRWVAYINKYSNWTRLNSFICQQNPILK